MRVSGRIEKINKIIVSDPCYGQEVKCRYERNNLNITNWQIEIEINDVSEIIDGEQINGTEFFIVLRNPDCYCSMQKNGSFSYENKNEIRETIIGMDTPYIALGINEFADKIREAKDEWRPEISLETLTDGLFGHVKEGYEGEKINFIWISGYLDEDTGYSIENIIDYLEKNLEIKELECSYEKSTSTIEENLDYI